MQSSGGKSASIILFCGLVLASRLCLAEPLADLRKFSVFEQADLSKLAGGKVMAARGPALESPRDLSIQSIYVVPAPLAKAVELHRQWDPTRHPELKVYLHGDLGAKPSPGDFAKLNPSGTDGAARRALDRIPANGPFQVSSAEAPELKASGGGRGGDWSGILLRRAQAFSAKGLAGEPPYEMGKETVRVVEEAARLLKEQPKLRAQFHTLVDQTPLGGGSGALAPQAYWELFDVEGQGALSLGASYSKEAADSAQMLDLQYYASGGYFIYFTLYQLWPVTIDGKPATLVWRGDSIASANLSELRGVERMGSGAAMMKEVQKMATSVLKDLGR